MKSTPLSKKLGTYLVAGAAATTAGISSADAEICDSLTTVTLSTVGETANIDIDGDGTDDFAINVLGTFNGQGASNSTFFTFDGFGSNMMGIGDGTYVAGANNYISAFAGVGSLSGSFGAGSPMQAEGVALVRYPTTGGNHYVDGSTAALTNALLGLSFDIGGETHYGAFSFDIDVATAPSSLTFNFQWEKVADAAFVSSIPEPSSIALLALGAVGICARRKK